ncbi:hypothetical protein [Caldivirga sp.]|uniref:hypothetical protein n=1 Tax=Caldivirga sp. TaxID=2080243 RepID=UPI0025BF1124|nr:hypothetical protein [Caldivirga sp.]
MRGIVVRIEYALIGDELIVREDLNGLIKALRRLPKNHRTRLIMLGLLARLGGMEYQLR